MAKPTFADLQKLFSQLLLPFYHIDRDISTPPPKRRKENDAEHSWSLALVACALAPEVDPALDVGLIAQFATVHDVVEVHAGDTSPMDGEDWLGSKEAREERAFAWLKQEFAAFPWLVQTYAQYERQDTEEARFVRSIDKILPLFLLHLDGFRYDREKKLTAEAFTQRMQHHRKKALVHSGAFAYYEEVWDALMAHPEWFYKPAAAPERRTGKT